MTRIVADSAASSSPGIETLAEEKDEEEEEEKEGLRLLNYKTVD